LRRNIALFLMDGGEYQGFLRDDCVTAAEGHAFSVRVQVADNNWHRQVQQIEACLREPPGRRPTIIMVSPVNEAALRPTAAAAARLGIGWVMLLRWIDYLKELRDEFPSVPIFAALANQEEIGRIQGAQLRALLPLGGPAVYIRGPLASSSAKRRFAGLQEALSGSRIDLALLDSDFSFAGGKRVMKGQVNVFQRSGPAKFVVAAQNDAMAMGARSALEEAAGTVAHFSTERISFCGIDGTPTYGQRLVDEGTLTATVVMPSGAGLAIEAIASFLGGRSRPPALLELKPYGFPPPQRLQRLVSTPPPKPRFASGLTHKGPPKRSRGGSHA
jgi:ABC-type sugar transport system substrate-binding protein